ncbi:MAG: plasmid mobilization protein [Candidatus Ornithomonoglobus sp.]
MRKRNNRMTLRLDDKELNTLTKAADSTGVPKEVYLRMLIMSNVPKEKPTADFYSMTRELNAIGNSMNQIAKVANAKGFINVGAYEENVKKLNQVILQITGAVIKPERMDNKWLLQEYGL